MTTILREWDERLPVVLEYQMVETEELQEKVELGVRIKSGIHYPKNIGNGVVICLKMTLKVMKRMMKL